MNRDGLDGIYPPAAKFSSEFRFERRTSSKNLSEKVLDQRTAADLELRQTTMPPRGSPSIIAIEGTTLRNRLKDSNSTKNQQA